MIKSLPSTYNGVLFRSRLEARWACLFDSYGLKWVYEPEGFETPGGNYLPDFLLPSLNCFVEVKPAAGLANFDICEWVSRMTGKDFLILDAPSVECRVYPLFKSWCGDPAEWRWHDTSWCFSSKYLHPRGQNNDEHRFFVDTGFDPPTPYQSGECNCGGGGGFGRDRDLFQFARNLRFNNGVAA